MLRTGSLDQEYGVAPVTERRAKHRRVLAGQVARLSRSCTMLAFGPRWSPSSACVGSMSSRHESILPGLLGPADDHE